MDLKNNGNNKPVDWRDDKTFQDCMMYMLEKEIMCDTKCSELLRSTATSADAVVTLSTANQFHLDDLQKESLHYIEENTEICLSSSYAVELNSNCVQMILISEHLSCSETEFCKFFLKWIKTQCQLQGKEANAKNMRDKPRYPRIPNKNGQTHNIYRHSTCSRTLQNVSINALKFHLNRSVWFKGCIIFGPANTNISHEQHNMFTFELTDDSENVVCWEVLKISSGTTFNNTVALNLAKPMLLHADTQYTISVHDIKPQTYYGINCNSVCIHDSVTITFENSPKSTTMTSVTQ
ncbi:unnamed protein product [Mytilus edulis]|uniref:PHR domain-containing protein n=1 Tax=Mytilus edulis TaxID=6550 RepID=A0A8S3UZA5_MYTED|nr:unnamed protein product [Mytilus edulis]